MATIGVLSYTNQTSIQQNKITGINRNKCTMAANNNNNNTNIVNNNNNNNKINLNTKLTKCDTNKLKPVIKQENGPPSKKQKILPLSETKVNIINSNASITTTAPTAMTRSEKLAKTLKRPLPEIDISSPCRASGGKSKVFPPPMAVARRNARERNRVKQVNNGFAALRERIPEEVAEAFEAQGTGRGANKKLSKVETLRMAVEYIRSLEKILEIDSSASSINTSLVDYQISNESYQMSDTSSVLSTLTPPPSDNISTGSFDEVECLLPDATIIDGHHYVRIPGTNTYQLYESVIGTDDSAILYENDENLEPILDNQTAITLIQPQHQPLHSPIEYAAVSPNLSIDGTTNCYTNNVYSTISTPVHILTPASISPGAYSVEQSSTAGLSPAIHDINSIVPTTTSMEAKVSVKIPSLGDKQKRGQQQLQHTQQTHHHHHNQQQQQQPAQLNFIEIAPNEMQSTLSVINDDGDDSALYLNLNQLTEEQQQQLHQTYEGILSIKTEFKDNDINLSEDEQQQNMLEAINWWNTQNNGQIIHS